MTTILLSALPPAESFPLTNLWRLAILDSQISIKLGVPTIVPSIEKRLAKVIEDTPNIGDVSKSVLLTTLRLRANAFAYSAALVGDQPRAQTTQVLVAGLLHPDTNVRTSAASVAFNIAARRHLPLKLSKSGKYNWAEVYRRERAGEGESDVELICALLEVCVRV